MSKSEDYGNMCKAGRRAAAAAILDHQQSGNTPRFVSEICKAARDEESGYGAGFLFALAERVA